MFLRYKIVNGEKYYQIVETVKGKQRVVKYLGTVQKILEVFDTKGCLSI